MDSCLCAYIVCSENIKIKDIREYISKLVPTYMIPSYFIKLDDIPINSNGKVDRKHLLGVEISLDEREIINSRNSTDEIIINTLNHYISINQISITDSLIDLGFDSLMIINLSIELSNKLHISISVKDIFTNPIIANLSDYISAKLNSSNNTAIPKVDEMAYYPTSSAQKRMYYSSKMDNEDSTLYNVSGGIILDTLPNIEKFEKCLNRLIYRHESLRTYFEIADENIVQKIKQTVNFKLTIENGNYSEIDNITKDFIRPFKLSEAPLFRAKLVKLDNGKCLTLLDMHHIISDGTSLSILLKELCALYNGETLEENKLDYKDFSVWENTKLNSDEYIQSEKYWVKQFEDEISLLNMPTTYPRPNTRSFEGSSLCLNLDSSLTDKINDAAKKLGVTPYMLLLSVYYILLYKYTGQSDIIVGTPIVGRDLAELTNIVGMFVNTLALRSNVTSSITFNEYLNNIKELCLSSFNHQTYPFNELVDKLKVKREPNRSPLFDTMFIYQNNGYSTITLDGIKGENYIPDNNVSKFDLSLEVIPKDDILDLRFEYCTALFDNNYIERLSKHYINILETILENSNIDISNIDMLSAEEKNELLYKFNDTEVSYDKNVSLIELFEEQVDKNPDKIAIVFENQEVSYKELNQRANQVAHYLISKNIKRNNIVGIMLNRSVETIVCMIGVLKSGAGYMLIDKDLPFDRILYMLENSNSSLLITSSNIKDIEFENKLYIDTEDFSLFSRNNNNLYSSNEDSFCVIYTSGSTGNPKGVELKRKGIINMLISYKKFLYTDSCNNFLSMSTVSFDMFVVENFIPLLSGKAVILTNEESQKIPIFTNELIKNKNVNFVLTTPSRMELLLSNIKDKKDWESIKVIQLGGEVFTSALYNNIRKYTSSHIFNGYGPTELTACCSNKEITSNNSPTIGIPFCNTKMLICDQDMNLCPIGIDGEICVMGEGLAKGYINNQEITDKNFVPNPFSYGLIYKTGDVGRYRSDGEIEYIGRKDFQIKIRGLRVELSEIEKQLLLIPHINNSTVIYRKTDSDEYIIGFVLATEKLNITNVRTELSRHLPLYMVPKYIIQLDSFPITTNGKINKKELLKYEPAFSIVDNYVAPETELQELFCKIWEQLLEVKVGIDDNVFELGADSLIAIKFKTELLSHNINIPYSDIFKYTTIRTLCETHDTAAPTEDISAFDYSNIHSILSKNSIDNIGKNKIIYSTNNNILLLGGNGFVGSHVLYNFIKNDTGNAYCIIRNKNSKSAHERFINSLHFYFGNELDSFIDKRIFIIGANITEENFGLPSQKYTEITNNTSIVINAAATVKHYGQIDNFKTINLDLTQSAIDYCKKYNKRLIHLSTTSISGNTVIDDNYISKNDNNKYFLESNLYVGQSLDTLYVKSKFEAEKLILNNMANGLDAQILRLGNIASRYSDGNFQINPHENAFVNRLKTFINIGYVPESLSTLNLEFTPVDSCANAIICIMQNYVENFSVFHIYDNHHISMHELVNQFNNLNIKLTFIGDNQFNIKIKEILSNKEKQDILSGIIYDMDINRELDYSNNITVSSDFSKSFLHTIHFDWPIIDNNYLEKYIKYLKHIKFI